MNRRKPPVLEWVLLLAIVVVVVLGALRALTPGENVAPSQQPVVSEQPSQP